jgi:hypothetical protein
MTTPAYMPFTHLAASNARILNALVGPVVIYQPIKKRVAENLGRLTADGMIELRAPLTQDDDRLCAALAELIDWGRMNPGRSTAGANIVRTAQPEIPFFDDTAVSRIRSELRRREAAAGPEPDRGEAQFNARLFLALAQENDLAGESLDQHLSHFQTLATAFLENLPEADGAAFNRQNRGSALWQQDPGARLTGQRMRAWATLAAADPTPPELLITTSSAVIDWLIEPPEDLISLEKLAEIRISLPPAGTAPLLLRALAALAARPTGSTEALADLTALTVDGAAEPTVCATVYRAADQSPATFLRRMARAAVVAPLPKCPPPAVRHTLIMGVTGPCQIPLKAQLARY